MADGTQEQLVVKAGAAWKASGSSEDKSKVESAYTAYAEHMRGNGQTPKSLYNVLGYPFP